MSKINDAANSLSREAQNVPIENATSLRLDKFYNGLIIHPFKIKYNSACWIAQDVNDIFRGVTFTTTGCEYDDYSSSVTISYWNENENGKSLDDVSLDDLTFLNDNYDEVEMSINNDTLEGDSGNIRNNASSVTYTFKDLDDIQFTDWIFYGTDDFSMNYKIEYFTTSGKFHDYWPTVKNMIKSINTVDPITNADLPHGIRVGEAPTGAVFDSGKKLLYVVNSESNSISIINSSTNKEIGRVPVEKNPPPFGLALDETMDTLYVAHYEPYFDFTSNPGLLSIIKNASTTTRNVTNTTIDGNPFEVIVDSKNGKLYIGDLNNDTVIVLNRSYDVIARHEIEPIPRFENLPTTGFGLAMDNIASTIYVVDSKSGGVTLIDENTDIIQDYINITGTDTNLTNACVVDVAVDSGIDRAYVVDTKYCDYNPTIPKGQLLVIDTNNREVINKIPVGALPSNVVVNPQTHRIYVTNNLNDSITVIEPVFHTTTQLKVGAGPTDVALNPKTSIAYITNQPTNSITMIDESRKKVVQSIDFSIVPSNAGVITCSNIDYNANNSHGLILNEEICKAHPKPGFIFDSWSGNVKDLSHERPAHGSIFLQALSNDPGGLEIRSSGDLLANFRPAPAPIPPEYWAGLIGIAIAIFTGYLAPNAAQWINSFRQRKNMMKHYNKLKELHINELEKYRKDEIMTDYGNGKISEKQYEILNEEISDLEKQVEGK